jgi:hypothetical protein
MSGTLRREIKAMLRAFAITTTLFAACTALPGVAHAQAHDPFGTSKFESYSDIDQLKQLKVVWDFNFQDPKTVGIVLNNLSALMKATTEFGDQRKSSRSRW